MSNDEYTILELKRLIATLYFKYVASELISNEDAIEMADKLLKDLSRS